MAVPVVGAFLAIVTNAIRKGITKVLEKTAGQWFRSLVRQQVVSKVRSYNSPGQILATGEKSSFWQYGNMYFFAYDPKHKETLPYYDMFPLILPVEKYSDGFLGINFHYLYPKDRAILLDQLMRFANNKNLDETTRIQLSYQSLGNFTRYKRAKPCLHRYLDTFMKSQMVLVPPADWGTALFLPVERFRKMNKTAVWAESASAMNRIGI